MAIWKTEISTDIINKRAAHAFAELLNITFT